MDNLWTSLEAFFLDTVLHPAVGAGAEYSFIADFCNKKALGTGPDCGVNYSKGSFRKIPPLSILLIMVSTSG